MLSKKKKSLKELESQWGKPVSRTRNMDFISIYYDNMRPQNENDFVDDKTWSDLEFDAVFTKMDRCVSGPGQQYLYYLLHKYESKEAVLKDRFGLIHYFIKNKTFRFSTQVLLKKLSTFKAYFIPSLIVHNIPPRSNLYYLLIFLSVLSMVSVSLIYFYPICLYSTVGLLLLNIFINKKLSAKVYAYFAGFSSLNTLLIIAGQMCKLETDYNIPQLDNLRKQKDEIKKLKKKIGRFVMEKEGLNDLLLYLIEYFNLFFLFDLIAYYGSVNELNKYQARVCDIFENVASLDAHISVASYLADTERYSSPTFNDEKKISFTNLYHPLLEKPVANSLEPINKSMLITGSNMSGKTTFIKSVGINAILAQTFYFCHAENFALPKYQVKTAINREEDLEHSKSYFFVEVEGLKKFIQIANEQENTIFLIDEIFRGTNTVERLAISTSVLEHLGQNGQVFVTTHDIELQSLLKDSYEMYHFGDNIKNNEFYFSYKIQKGPCFTGNAIKLLEIQGYPEAIITKAQKIKDQESF